MIKQSTAVLGLVGLLCTLMLGIGSAHAQATRTWVSGVGDDVNPCSRTAPCKTWAGAISKTADCGEIDALDPGGFGTVTITKGIILEGVGTDASILNSGTNGINVNDVSTTCTRVQLRNLQINGDGTTLGTNGINVIAGGQLTLENVSIYNDSGDCVKVLPTTRIAVTISDSHFEGCANAGVETQASTGVNRINIIRSTIVKTGVGVNLTGTSDVTISDSLITANTTGGVRANASTSTVTVGNSTVANNSGYGLYATNSGAIFITGDMIAYNSPNGLQNDTGGTITTFSNNQIVGNPGAPTNTQAQQ
jgi:hypothetical protein